MKPGQVVPLNYCAHAIESLSEQLPLYEQIAPQSARTIRMVIGMLKESVKFILPDRCELIDPDDLRQAHLDLVHLPYPCVAFEAAWPGPDKVEQVGPFTQHPATKRIALCWEPRPEYELQPGLNDNPVVATRGGVFVLPVFWMPSISKWQIGMGGMFVPSDAKMRDRPIEEAPAVTQVLARAMINSGRSNDRSKQFEGEPFVAFPEVFTSQMEKLGSREYAFAEIGLDSTDEVLMLIKACSVLNCANIATVDVEPSRILNKKREQKGKQPFFTYKVLQLSDERQPSSGSGAGGQHASPRMHLRRGHLRRLETKTVWVRPAMVNAGSERGVVVKDYAVNTSDKAPTPSS